MTRRRDPEHDWICRRCMCACTGPGEGAKHVGGGPGMRACRFPPDPVLRSVYEAGIASDIAALRARVPRTSEVDT